MGGWPNTSDLTEPLHSLMDSDSSVSILFASSSIDRCWQFLVKIACSHMLDIDVGVSAQSFTVYHVDTLKA